MRLGVEIEYYPKITRTILDENKKIVNTSKSKWDSPFFLDTKSYLDHEKIKQVVQPFLNKNIENIIVLGTGGSIQTLMALAHLSKKKIFAITSSRAVELKDCLQNTRPEDSVVIPISRGGETLDINSTIEVFSNKKYKFIGLSSKGIMYEILSKLQCPILDVPDLSGRFAGSISNVGIVPAYIADIDVMKFLSALGEAYQNYMNYEMNIALEFASFLFKLYNQRYILAFSMPYSKHLEGSVGLFVQEISESTGKNEKGLMGVYQSAPLCQHSILEYLLGGTKGTVIPLLWATTNESEDFKLNSTIDYINGHGAQEIVNFQADATFQALLEQNVPSAKITVKNTDESSIAHLIAFIQSTIYYLCLLLDVNWADNPKVAIGKKICNEFLISNKSIQERKNLREKIAQEKFQKL